MDLAVAPDSQDLSFGISIPKPFRLQDQDKTDLDKIKSEIMDKVSTWERRIAPFARAFERGGDSWRIKPNAQKKSSKQLFNSKSGETHRAAETLATLWHRMVNGSKDGPNFEAYPRGMTPWGTEVTEDDLYCAEGVLIEQMNAAEVKRKQLRTYRSLALMGISCIELPFVSRPYGPGRKTIEYTDWCFKPMSRVGFDTMVYDLRDSDYIFTIDFVSKWMLRNLASLDNDFWDPGVVERHIDEFKNGAPAGSGVGSRLLLSRTKAGYLDRDSEIYETINYHGRLETDNSVIQAYAESVGLDQDPQFVDWSVSILDGFEIGKFHMTQYGDWRTRFLTTGYKEFEDEPLPYGIAQIGRRLQRDMDINESASNDLMAAFTYMMFKIGKFSGYNEKQLGWEPLKTVELEDINQLAPLTPDPNAFKIALEMLNLRREDFRNVVGAQTNLQAQVTGASATESAIAQTEAIRGAGVHGEIIGETYRKYLEISHINNLNYLDEPIWVGLTGSKKPMLVNKNILPTNVGFRVKIVTDADFRPERLQKLLEALQMETSVRNFVPPDLSINAINELHDEIWKTLGMNPRKLHQGVPLIQQMQMMAGKMPNGMMGNEVQGEQTGAQAGQATTSTPMGPVPTSQVDMPNMSA